MSRVGIMVCCRPTSSLHILSNHMQVGCLWYGVGKTLSPQGAIHQDQHPHLAPAQPETSRHLEAKGRERGMMQRMKWGDQANKSISAVGVAAGHVPISPAVLGSNRTRRRPLTVHCDAETSRQCSLPTHCVTLTVSLSTASPLQTFDREGRVAFVWQAAKPSQSPTLGRYARARTPDRTHPTLRLWCILIEGSYGSIGLYASRTS